ncbi:MULTISPECIES: hypothetical protein [unclassified Mycobacterium]|uniref:Rv1815 family serine proteinase n=1 Tax=unclassified Mycobacterium TaxID=2642494 RepID=UPI0008017ED7|nr:MULTISPECIES: hypothetical protein [unclassified Mycobacterium]OBG56252.1 hypothetical protein A5704_24220 [Mycobacterium sp. E735]OBG64357.1 hypothetical protein A5703_17855 [Mycobacterium sp. E188]OBG79010.1 hypothetical protein A5701_14735 [Mycobacterium sp. E3305]OBG79390.1 hypothetical protein A9X05_22255 [Mycobacterium sp. E3298]OBH36112.1 hypothetical protein A5691_05130 [Mycobacterium sp. E183]
MEMASGRNTRVAIAFAFTIAITVVGYPAPATATPAVTAFPGMEIRQGGAVCMVGLVEPRLRVAVTSGQCGNGESDVTDHDGNPVGKVVLARRQAADDVAASRAMSPVEYEVIALGPDVTASDQLPTGRQLKSSPGLRAQPGLPVCQFRRSVGQRCGSITSVSEGRFIIADVAVDSRDFGGPVYALTDDNAAVIVGLFEGMWGSVPEMESWQAVMQQVYIDGRAQNQQPQPPGEPHMVGLRVPA